MGLFKKKDPCAICGGVVKGLLAWKVEGRYICDDCYGTVDLPGNAVNEMTLDDFRNYLAFRDENRQLKEKFQVTQQIDFGWLDTKFMFDTDNRLMCMDKSLNKTIFEGVQIKSFLIKEDEAPLFEGSASGFIRYDSTVPKIVRAMAPQIRQRIAEREMQENMERMMDRMDDGKENNSTRSSLWHGIDIAPPFENYNIEICFDHPYWDVITADMKGPTFSKDIPDVNDFLNEYHDSVALMEQLARALKDIAFPDAPEQEMDLCGTEISDNEVSAPNNQVDPVQEIQRYKGLLDQGIITEEEFAAKKRQLLGI